MAGDKKTKNELKQVMGSIPSVSPIVQQTPVATRYLMFISVFGAILSLVPTEWTANCPTLVMASGTDAYRLILSPLFSSSLFDGLCAVFAVYHLAFSIELHCGSLFCLVSAILLYLLTNLAYHTTFILLSSDPSFTLYMDKENLPCTAGPWPILLGLATVKAQLCPQLLYRITCLPFAVSSQMFPLILLVFGLVWTNLDLGLVFGLIMGHLVSLAHSPRSHTCKRMEATLKCKDSNDFICVANAGRTLDEYPFPVRHDALTEDKSIYMDMKQTVSIITKEHEADKSLANIADDAVSQPAPLHSLVGRITSNKR